MNLMQTLRERIGGVIAAVIGSVLFCICGAVFTFYLAPRQALEANRIARLPQMDAAYVLSAAPGDEILVTGSLQGNPKLVADLAFVAYHLEEWNVSMPDPDSEDNTPDGDWVTVEKISPELTIQLDGQDLSILSSTSVSFSGGLHEARFPGPGPDSANFSGEDLPDGTLRYRGFFNGDLVTVLGEKASVGGIIPGKLFAGDRVAFEKSEEDAARGLLIGGIVMMACAPIVLIGGGLAAMFGRRRRRGLFD